MPITAALATVGNPTFEGVQSLKINAIKMLYHCWVALNTVGHPSQIKACFLWISIEHSQYYFMKIHVLKAIFSVSVTYTLTPAAGENIKYTMKTAE